MALGGFSGRSTRLLSKFLATRAEELWPPVFQTVQKLAYLLAHILPAPVMLVAANRLSTGVGVRPRGNRVEVTVDFTPAPTLSIATAALVTGIARAVMAWPSYELDMLDTMAIPVIRGFRPIPHTSRKGWLAHATSFDASPFEVGPDARRWRVSDAYRRLTGDDRAEHSLREVAEVVFRRFLTPIRQIANPFSDQLFKSRTGYLALVGFIVVVGIFISALDSRANAIAQRLYFITIGCRCNLDRRALEFCLTFDKENPTQPFFKDRVASLDIGGATPDTVFFLGKEIIDDLTDTLALASAFRKPEIGAFRCFE